MVRRINTLATWSNNLQVAPAVLSDENHSQHKAYERKIDET